MAKKGAAIVAHRKNIWDAERVRVLLDLLDEEKGQESLFITDPTAARQLVCSEIKERVRPNAAIGEIDSRQVDNKLSAIVRRWTTYDTEKNQPLAIYGSAAVDPRKLPEGTYTASELEARLTAYDRRYSSKKSEKQERREESVAASDDDGEEITTVSGSSQSQQLKRPTISPLTDDVVEHRQETPQKRQKVALPPEEWLSTISAVLDDTAFGIFRADERKIVKAMNDLSATISKAISDYLEGSPINGTHQMPLDFVVNSDKLVDLLGVMLGASRTNLKKRLGQLTGMQYAFGLSIDTFLQSLLAAAVLRWTLEPPPEADSTCRMYDELITLMMAANPVKGYSLKQAAQIRYLESHIVPAIPDRAVDMAQAFMTLSKPLLPQLPSAERGHVARGVTLHEGQIDPDHPSRGNLSASLPLTMPAWIANWRNDLEGVFTEALKARASMAMVDGQFTFDFPAMGQNLQPAGKQVILPIFPAVRLSERDTSNGGWKDPKILVEAEAYCCGPA